MFGSKPVAKPPIVPGVARGYTIAHADRRWCASLAARELLKAASAEVPIVVLPRSLATRTAEILVELSFGRDGPAVTSMLFDRGGESDTSCCRSRNENGHPEGRPSVVPRPAQTRGMLSVTAQARDCAHDLQHDVERDKLIQHCAEAAAVAVDHLQHHTADVMVGTDATTNGSISVMTGSGLTILYPPRWRRRSSTMSAHNHMLSVRALSMVSTHAQNGMKKAGPSRNRPSSERGPDQMITGSWGCSHYTSSRLDGKWTAGSRRCGNLDITAHIRAQAELVKTSANVQVGYTTKL